MPNLKKKKLKLRLAPPKSKPPLTMSQKVELAAEIITANAGVRSFTLASKVIKILGCSRRSALRYLARAREELAKQRDERLTDLAGALPEKYADALTRAKKADDLKAEAKILAGAARLVEKIPARKEDANMPPHKVEFIIIDSADLQ